MEAVALPPGVRELLDAEPAALRARWEALDAPALEAEIQGYKEALRSVLAEFTKLGAAGGGGDGRASDQSSLWGSPPPPPPPTRPVAGTRYGAGEEGGDVEGQEGQEGVDWRYGSVDDLDPSEWHVPPHCIPIHANVTTYDWSRLIAATQFDVIMMDPPWQLATANPTRGVALGYSQVGGWCCVCVCAWAGAAAGAAAALGGAQSAPAAAAELPHQPIACARACVPAAPLPATTTHAPNPRVAAHGPAHCRPAHPAAAVQRFFVRLGHQCQVPVLPRPV